MRQAGSTTLGHVPTCRECGSAVADEDRFCSSCGATTADEPSALLGAESAVSQSSEVTTAGATRFVVPALLGLVLIVGLFWALARSSTGADDADNNDDAAAAEQSSSTQKPTTTAPTTSADRPLSFDPATDVESGPLLGREVGLSLFVGGGSSLKRVDLDTAQIVEFDVGRRRPVFATGQWLITGSEYSDDLQVVSLTDPESTATPLGSSGFWPTPVFAGPDPDSVWIIRGGFPDASWDLVSLVDGEVIEERPVGQSWFFDGGPDLATTPAGGIYEFVDGEYVHVFDGQLSAASNSVVLAATCKGPTDCRYHWLDRETWEEIDRPLPGLSTVWANSLSPDGRILTFYNDHGPGVYDVERGEQLRLAVQTPEEMAVSPDGRYLAATVSGEVIIHDLDTLKRYKLDAFASGSLLFTETPDDASADEPEVNVVSGTGE